MRPFGAVDIHQSITEIEVPPDIPLPVYANKDTEFVSADLPSEDISQSVKGVHWDSPAADTSFSGFVQNYLTRPGLRSDIVSHTKSIAASEEFVKLMTDAVHASSTREDQEEHDLLISLLLLAQREAATRYSDNQTFLSLIKVAQSKGEERATGVWLPSAERVIDWRAGYAFFKTAPPSPQRETGAVDPDRHRSPSHWNVEASVTEISKAMLEYCPARHHVIGFVVDRHLMRFSYTDRHRSVLSDPLKQTTHAPQDLVCAALSLFSSRPHDWGLHQCFDNSAGMIDSTSSIFENSRSLCLRLDSQHFRLGAALDTAPQQSYSQSALFSASVEQGDSLPHHLPKGNVSISLLWAGPINSQADAQRQAAREGVISGVAKVYLTRTFLGNECNATCDDISGMATLTVTVYEPLVPLSSLVDVTHFKAAFISIVQSEHIRTFCEANV